MTLHIIFALIIYSIFIGFILKIAWNNEVAEQKVNKRLKISELHNPNSIIYKLKPTILVCDYEVTDKKGNKSITREFMINSHSDFYVIIDNDLNTHSVSKEKISFRMFRAFYHSYRKYKVNDRFLEILFSKDETNKEIAIESLLSREHH